MRKITADYIYPVSSKPLKNGIVIVGNKGEILDLIDTQGSIQEVANLEHYNGIIVPGFVNAHCHLELSYFKHLEMVSTRGLPHFIKNIVSLRDQPEAMQLEAIAEADCEMRDNGIVAVGDISNSAVSFKIKADSTIDYYTFLEVFTMGQKSIYDIMNEAQHLLSLLKNLSLSSSIVPHAPYSVPPQLYDAILKTFNDSSQLYSVHNQETTSENSFYHKSGALYDMFLSWGVDLSVYPHTKQSSIRSTAGFFPVSNHKLLIHNIFTTKEDIHFLLETSNNIHFVLCPNSNLLIEQQLPNVPLLIESGLNIALGTDSYASNQQLSILSEMQTLSKSFPDIAFEILLEMACINGAKALKYENKFGSIEKGKTPGLNLITSFDYDQKKLSNKSKLKVLVR